jgi:prevent-host-death family protein
MESINVADARKHFSDLMARVAYRGERVVVERHGRPMMAWVSMADLARLQALEAGSDALRARRLAALEQAAALRGEMRARRRGQPLPPSDDLLHELRSRQINESPADDYDLR